MKRISQNPKEVLNQKSSSEREHLPMLMNGAVKPWGISIKSNQCSTGSVVSLVFCPLPPPSPSCSTLTTAAPQMTHRSPSSFPTTWLMKLLVGNKMIKGWAEGFICKWWQTGKDPLIYRFPCFFFIHSTNTYWAFSMCDALVSDWVDQWVPATNVLNASPAFMVSAV